MPVLPLVFVPVQVRNIFGTIGVLKVRVVNMSCWTYIIGSICVEPNMCNWGLGQAKVEKFLLTAPPITGSERDAKTTVYLGQNGKVIIRDVG